MRPSILVFTSSSHATVFHHITIAKCVNAWPTHSPNLNPTGFFFLLRYLKVKAQASTVDIIEALWRRMQQFANEVKNTSGIFEGLRVSLSLRAVMCVRQHGGHFESLLYEGKIKEVTNSFFVCFFLMHNPLHL
jgi:hypothetical protein